MSIINKKNNVSGNWSHKLGKKYNIAMGKTKEFITKKQIKHGAQFQKYAGPTVKLGKGVVYRKIKVKKKTFNDPKWQKKNPHLYDTFKRPMPKKMPPLNVYNPASNKKYMAG